MAMTESDEHQDREVVRGEREHRQRETQEAVAAHLQEDRGQDDRARGRRLDMRVRQPGVDRPHRHLHRERREEREPQPRLHLARERMAQQHGDIGGAGLPVHRHDGEQHQHRAEQRVEEELEARVDPARAAPHPDDQEHRDQAALEEQVEQHQVERRERADHQGLEHQKRDHVLLDAHLHRQPARHDAKRHDRRGEDDQWQRDAIDAHVVGAVAAEPGDLLDELELRRAGVEPRQQDERHREGDDGRPQRDPAGVAPGRLVLAAQHQNEEDARNRQEGRDGEDRPARHQCTPPCVENMNQVISAAAPSSMAKA